MPERGLVVSSCENDAAQQESAPPLLLHFAERHEVSIEGVADNYGSEADNDGVLQGEGEEPYGSSPMPCVNRSSEAL